MIQKYMADRQSIVGAAALQKHLANRRSLAGAAVIVACVLGVTAYLGIIGASASISASPDAQYQTGKSLAQKSQCSDAIGAYARALTKDPSFVKAYVGEAQCYRSLGSYGQAIAAYSQAIKADPNNPSLFVGRSAMYQLNGQSGYASADCRSAERLSTPTFVTVNQISACFANVQDYGGQAAVLSHALARFPTNSDLYRTKVGVDETTGNTGAALTDARMAYQVASTPAQQGQALSVGGDVYASQSDYSRAISSYKRAIAVAPFLADPWVGLAGALAAQGHTESAVDTYESAERAQGMAATSRALLYRAHGDLLLQLGNPKGAAAAWRAGLRLAVDPALRSSLRHDLASLSS